MISLSNDRSQKKNLAEMVSWCDSCKKLQSGKFCADCGGKISHSNHATEAKFELQVQPCMATDREGEDDLVIVSNKFAETLVASIESASREVSNEDDYPFYAHAIRSAAAANEMAQSEKYDQREDIVQMKEIPKKLQENLKFDSKDKLQDVLKAIQPSEKGERNMVLEVKKILNVESNVQLEDERLKEAARVFREKAVEAQEIAIKGKATLKRAMNVIDITLPVFLKSCEKATERTELSEELNNESIKYEQCLLEKQKSAFSLRFGQEKMAEARKHLEKCIQLATNDQQKISEKRMAEETENRIKRIDDAEKEAGNIISGHLDNIDDLLSSCNADLNYLAIIKDDQNERTRAAAEKHRNRIDSLEMKVELNKKSQEELRKQLQKLANEERQLSEERMFQNEVQEKAEEWNKRILFQVDDLLNKISSIHTSASASAGIMKSMKALVNSLVVSSHQSEKEYLDNLKYLDIQAKQRLYTALATKIVENRISIENAEVNIEEYGEKYKMMKEDLKKAVQRQKRLECEKVKKELKQYKDEISAEKERKENLEKELTDLKISLQICENELFKQGQSVKSVDEFYELKKQEIMKTLDDDEGGYSLQFSEDEASSDEEI